MSKHAAVNRRILAWLSLILLIWLAITHTSSPYPLEAKPSPKQEVQKQSSHNLFADPRDDIGNRTPGELEIEIVRKVKIDKQKQIGCTPGEMYIQGKYFCQTLERPFKNAEQNISSIHPGIYEARLIYSTNKLQWRIQLQPITTYAYDKDPFVPSREIDRIGIQIHPGTKPAHTRGCILVGEGGTNPCRLKKSTKTFKRMLETYFGSSRKPDQTIKITVAIRDD